MQWLGLMANARRHILVIGPAVLFGAAVVLAGCQSTGERMMAHAARNDTCGARNLRSFIGNNADQATRDAIERRVLNKHGVRWIVPGEDILADLNVGRINVVLDRSGMIKGIGCY